MKASISQVAARAGVSRMTVSRVINDHAGVSSPTRHRVREAMAELEYVPSAAARSLRSGDKLLADRKHFCALIFGADTQSADGFFSLVARAAEQEAARHGLCILQSHWQESFSASWARLQATLALDGLCGAVLVGQFASAEVQAIAGRVGPVVVIDGPAPADVPVGAVEADNLGGCRLAVRHLAERGVQRLLVLTGWPDHYFTNAMTTAVNEAADRFAAVELVHTALTAEDGRRLVREKIADSTGGPPSFDGIFGNDELLIGALRALAELKIAVPSTVKLVGFDDIVHAAYTSPALTTVRIDKSHLGSEAVSTLVEMVRGQAAPGLKKIVQAALVQRESS